MCNFCESKEVPICNECLDKLRDKIGVICQVCGTVGMLDRTEKNIRRMEFFMPNFREMLNSYEICIVPMSFCPNCLNDTDVIKFGGSGGFTA